MRTERVQEPARHKKRRPASSCKRRESGAEMFATRKQVFGWLILLLAAAGAAGTLGRRPLVRAPRDTGSATTGDHLIVAEQSLSPEQFRELVARVSRLSGGAEVRSYVENVGKVITASLSPIALEQVRLMEGVDHIEEEDEARGDSLPAGWANVPWHLDRLDQGDIPMDQSYQPIGDGEGVDVYVLDSGIRYEHSEFEFRAKYAGYDPYDVYVQWRGLNSIPMQGRDCHGHGTHVASLCGGKTFGTAKKVTIYSVRVLSCQNSAPWSVVLDGLDFVSRVIDARMRPAVVSMSLSGSYHQSVNNAVMELHKKNIPVVTVAGNGETDCCNRSPASSAHAITVAGTRLGDGLYRTGEGTNFGSCVNIFAPGESITGASHICWNCSKKLSGTSMAAPMVAGIVAIHLARASRMTAQQVMERLVNDSLRGVINFQGMPSNYRPLTPNLLAQIPGFCGGSRFLLSESTFHTPMFPDQYPANLKCEWSIAAEEGQQVQVTFHTIRTERNFDLIQVVDGPCKEHSKNIMATISGDLGTVNVTFLSPSPSLCIRFTSDGVTQLAGFNASYTKLYHNTTLTVVGPPRSLFSPQSQLISTVLVHHTPTKDVQGVLERHQADGYTPTWCSMYGSGQQRYADIIFTNSSLSRSLCLPEVGNKSLPRVLQRRAEEGYQLWHVATVTRGRNITRPVFYLLLKPIPAHLEHVCYLRESESDYLSHLATHTAQNYTLVSQSFYYLDDQLFASSVYTRDRRIPLGIPIRHSPPQRWRSFYNLPLDEFVAVLGRQANESFYPTHVDTHRDATGNESRFSLVLQEKERRAPETLIIWGLNETAMVDAVARNRAWFKPELSLGYIHGNNQEFYLQMIRKHPHDI